jgi:hypothetical protein
MTAIDLIELERDAQISHHNPRKTRLRRKTPQRSTFHHPALEHFPANRTAIRDKKMRQTNGL